MIEFTENAASTRYVIFVNQNCSDHSGAVQRTRAKRCLLAAGPLTRLTGFVQHELYRRPASMLAHFCCFSSILRLGLIVECAPIAHGADGGKGIGRFISLRPIRRLDHSECVHLRLFDPTICSEVCSSVILVVM